MGLRPNDPERGAFGARSRFVKSVVRTLGDLGDDLVLAPERHLLAANAGDGVALGDLVTLRGERVLEADLGGAVVLDTTHARDGVLDVGGALRDGAASIKSAKKRARAGDVIVSRLRPYLRQIAFVHPRALVPLRGRALAVSSEFYVLSPPQREGIAWLVPFLLGEVAQAALRDAQEGGHHPRVPQPSLLGLRVPHALATRAARTRTQRAVERELDALYRALQRLYWLTGATPRSSEGERCVIGASSSNSTSISRSPKA